MKIDPKFKPVLEAMLARYSIGDIDHPLNDDGVRMCPLCATGKTLIEDDEENFCRPCPWLLEYNTNQEFVCENIWADELGYHNIEDALSYQPVLDERVAMIQRWLKEFFNEN